VISLFNGGRAMKRADVRGRRSVVNEEVRQQWLQQLRQRRIAGAASALRLPFALWSRFLGFGRRLAIVWSLALVDLWSGFLGFGR